MKRQFIYFVFYLIAFSYSFASGRMIIVDSDSSTPIEGASVISERGMIIGITDKNGSITVASDKDFPLEIRSVGFEPTRIPELRDTVFIDRTTYALPEVTVRADERPIIKVVSYAREYCSAATPKDTMQLYADYMLVSYLPVNDKKVKGYKNSDGAIWPTVVRRYARFANSEGLDSVAKPDRFDNVSYLSYYDMLLGIPANSFPETDAIRAGSLTDSVMGKYSPYAIYRKSDDNYIITYDKLANYKEHRVSPTLFKMIGMTMDIDLLKSSFVYMATSDSLYTLDNFLYGTGSIHALAKGKMFKWMLGQKDFELDCYAELYPVEIEYLTVEEYKEDRKERKNRNPGPFKYPKGVQPLPVAVRRLVDRVSELP